MRMQMATAIIAALMFAGPAQADDLLVAQLRTLGKAVDDMSANISKAGSDADAELLANVTRQALDNGLKQDRPTIDIKASAGYCRVTIETPAWKMWSEARAGNITDHGATIHQNEHSAETLRRTSGLQRRQTTVPFDLNFRMA